VTSTIALEGNGVIKEYVGGCEEWLKKEEAKNAQQKGKGPTTTSPLPTPDSPPKLSLNNKEREALKTLPKKIEKMEAELATLSEKMASADYYQDPASNLTGDAKKLETLESDILVAYERLEALQ
jgi:ATP-binding cassette subfamily F protein uup